MSDKDNENEPKTATPPKSGANEASSKTPEEPARPRTSSRIPPKATTFESSGLGSLGGLFKGLNQVVNLISEMAEKAEQQSKENPEGNGASGEYKSGDGNRGFVIKWGINTGSLPDQAGSESPFTSREASSFSRPSARPAPVRPTTARPSSGAKATPSNPDLAPTIQEPYTEIHDEAEEGVIVLVVELPDVLKENLHVEIFDDVVMIRAEGPTCRYEKETLLPSMVNPEPQSYNYQNGILELRLKKH